VTRFGYFLSTEDWGPRDLVEQARMAERAGFEGLWISDHYHPWNDAQGNAPFVWTVIGALSQVVRLPVTTAVTCPTVRIHPAVVAQAAATAAVALEGRFVLGVGSGEALNEHILGDHWPPADVRLEMLEEAVQVMRLLWRGRDAGPPRPALHGGECPRLHPAGPPAASVRLRLRAEGGHPGRAHR
jgi:G6PDH family F420-dependent oxidoreductase